MNSDRETAARLQKVYNYGFAIDDVILYLDTHPDDCEARAYYNRMRDAYQDACQEYNEKGGPLTIMDVDVSSWWNWVEGPWPWEGGACSVSYTHLDVYKRQPDKDLQHIAIDLLILPFALTEKSRILIRPHNINFFLSVCPGICSPPAAKIRKIHCTLSIQQQPPEILPANFFKYASHKIRKFRSNTLIDQICCPAGNQRGILRHKTIPKPERCV